MSINLNELSLDELNTLKIDIADAIRNLEARKREDALVAIEAAAKKAGFKLPELLGSSKGSKTPPAPAKYRHPENQSLTWSGRGRPPAWYREAIEAGTPQIDLLIK